MNSKAMERKRKIEIELAKKELISSLNNVILELENAYDNYNLATGDLIDFYAYDIKAKQARYHYLREQLKLLHKIELKLITNIIEKKIMGGM